MIIPKLKSKLRNKGFIHVEFVFVLLVIAAVVGSGYYVLKSRGILTSSSNNSDTAEAEVKPESNSSQAEATEAERKYTFDVKKDNVSVLNKTISGQVAVGVNMNSDKDLNNVKFFVDGVERGSRAVIVRNGFREFYTWPTNNETNGKHRISVQATNAAGTPFDMFNAATNTKTIEVTINNKAGSTAPGPGSSGSSQANGSSEANQTAQVTAKPQLSVSPGPFTTGGPGVGTVKGDTVTGGIVFTVKFKRPKSEQYDLKTMHVDMYKDGELRLVMTNESNEIKVTEDGDFNVYTFRRFFNTVNKPNGPGNWVAKFNPSVATPEADKDSNQMTLNIDNPDSTAEKTCQQLKSEVNNLFTSMTTKIDDSQAKITDVNSQISRRYTSLNLATSNPIPNYDARVVSQTALANDIDNQQKQLEALKLKCNGSNAEDAGAKVVQFKAKIEEIHSLLAKYRSDTLLLLGDLRSRIPEDDDASEDPGGNPGDGDNNRPNAVNTKCYSYNPKASSDLIYVTTDQEGRSFNCLQQRKYQATNGEGPSSYVYVGPNSGESALAVAARVDSLFSRYPDFYRYTRQDLTVDGKQAVKFEYTILNSNQTYINVYIDGPSFSATGAGGEEVVTSGVSVRTGGSNADSAKSRFTNKVVNDMLGSWKWKNGGDVGRFDTTETVPDDKLSKVGCFDNGKDGKRVQVVYLKNAGQEGVDIDDIYSSSRHPSQDNLTNKQYVKRVSARTNRLVIESSQSQDGFRQVRYVTTPQCEVAVREVILDVADQSESIHEVYQKLVDKYQLNKANTKYLIFWTDQNLSDGICGVGGPIVSPGTNPTGSSTDPDPNINYYNNTSGMALSRQPCWGPVKSSSLGSSGITALHELFHMLGAVRPSAPNATARGHCTDENDAMCYKDGDNVRMQYGVCPGSYSENLLDCKGEDYFNVNPRAGSYLDRSWNTANSSFLTNRLGSNQR